MVTYDKKYVIEVINKTQYVLERVGSHNDSENWPLGDIQPEQLGVGKFDCNYFSFGVNYKLKGGSGFIQFAASWPLIGKRKIAVGNIHQDGNGPARKVWDEMDDPSDKLCSNDLVRVRAFMQEEGESIIWVYEVVTK
ncbi:hypothetical protein H4N54_15960 [Limnospira fusiformis KN01]|uniref:hypothetical protein n=1 Tax=Limnospira TaxID=2596745 RepID=UPI0016587DB8|nr:MULTISPECIES: hypothetical protein [Limnospira]MDT9200754.1 hypothetical protein [Limnospira sp. PMC 1042.18]MDT9232676.1 hypothetical protein [Limnospira sp. PMC 917.15]MDT9273590.1 hypothetical protein [Limnospira sp. PMC 737.11]ULB43952.1 hypothetical protein H4N54_15960 [Limnospira fusiformis KN01]